MLDQLFAGMLGARLDELSQSANPPFLRAAADRGLFPTPRTRDEAVLQALVSNDGVTRGLDALVTELQRVARFGFTATELARAKQAMMLGYERVVTESPDRESASRADEYTRNFLQGEALPTIWQELAFHRRFVPGITLGEVNALTEDWFPDRNRLVVVVGAGSGRRRAAGSRRSSRRSSRPPRRSGSSPTWTPAAGQTLMDAPPARGTIVKTTVRPEAGITEWTLSNGATVVLKPTTLKEDQILFRAAAPGRDIAGERRRFHSRSRRGRRRPGGRRRAVQRRDARQDPRRQGGRASRRSSTRSTRGWGAGARRRISKRCSSCMYLRFTQPRADPTAFAAMASQARGLLANQMASPDVVFNQTIDAALSRNSPRRQPETPATVDQWDLAKSLAFYKARFADASNFTFVFVGSFTPESHQAARRDLHRQPAGDARTRDVAGPRHRAARRASSRRRSRRASRRRARWRSSSPGRSSTTMRTGWRFGR